MLSKNKEIEKQEVWLPFYRDGSKIFEAVQYEGHNTFLCYQIDVGFSLHNEIETYNEIIHPVGGSRIPYQPYEITSEFYKKITDPNYKPEILKIYNKVVKELDTFLDIKEQYKQVLVGFIFETYQQHKIKALGYIANLGDKDSGKTRALEILNYLCYRPLLGVGIPEANIFNYIGTREEGLCTILEDEIQEVKGKNSASKLSIYRSGYRKGAKCARILDGSSKDRTQNFFKTFCSKAFSGYHLPRKDGALKTRCIPLPFVAGSPMKDEIDDEDEKRMQETKTELLIHRMMTYHEKFPELKVEIKNRVKEVWKGKILSVLGTPAEQTLTKLALDYQEQKTKKLYESLEAHILKTVIYLCRRYKWRELRFKEIWITLLRVLDIEEADQFKLPSVDVPLLGYPVSQKKVGIILGENFQGKKTNRRGLGRMWLFDKNDLKKLILRYGIIKKDVEEVEKIVNGVNDVNDVNGKTIKTNISQKQPMNAW